MFKENYYYKKDNKWLKCIHVNAGFFPSAILEDSKKKTIKVTQESFKSFEENQSPNDLKENDMYFVAIKKSNESMIAFKQTEKEIFNIPEIKNNPNDYIIIQGITI